MVRLGGKAEIASMPPEPAQSILGEVGDRKPRVSFGIPSGQIRAVDLTPVGQKKLGIFNPKIRYHFCAERAILS